jgi:hypothetical protein
MPNKRQAVYKNFYKSKVFAAIAAMRQQWQQKKSQPGEGLAFFYL